MQKLTLRVFLHPRLLMGLHVHQIPRECVSRGSALRPAVTAKLAPLKSLISVESVEVTTRAARKCLDSSQSLCEYHYIIMGRALQSVA